MRPFALFVCLLFAPIAPAQWIQLPTPNAVRLTKYILGVANLDRTYAFYHALGLTLDNATELKAPSTLPEPLLNLVDVPAGTKFRNMMLKVPNAPFELEVTEFSGLEVHPVKPRIQDPGAALLQFLVDDLRGAVATMKKAGAEVVTPGGSPVPSPGALAGAIWLRDPDGYYVELIQPQGVTGSGKLIGSGFGSMAVPDSDKAATFYRTQFGFLLIPINWSANFNLLSGATDAKARLWAVTRLGTNVNWGFFDTKGVSSTAYTPRIPDPGAAAVGLQVLDIDAAISAMKAAGGSSVTRGGTVTLGSGRVGFVRDPNGILVELAQK